MCYEYLQKRFFLADLFGREEEYTQRIWKSKLIGSVNCIFNYTYKLEKDSPQQKTPHPQHSIHKITYKLAHKTEQTYSQKHTQKLKQKHTCKTTHKITYKLTYKTEQTHTQKHTQKLKQKHTCKTTHKHTYKHTQKLKQTPHTPAPHRKAKQQKSITLYNSKYCIR